MAPALPMPMLAARQYRSSGAPKSNAPCAVCHKWPSMKSSGTPVLQPGPEHSVMLCRVTQLPHGARPHVVAGAYGLSKAGVCRSRRQ
jgi:hypothetical protein